MTAVLPAVASWIIAVIAATGYAGIVGLMAIESACIPLPSEVIMPFAGYLVSTGKLDLWLAATAGAVGCNLGSQIAYEVGRRGGRRFVNRFGRFILVTPADLDRAERFFEHFGDVAVVIARLLPGIRSFIAFPAGVAQMPLIRFHVATFLGSWPWCFGLAYLGLRLGERWQSDPRIAAFFHRFDLAIVAIALVVIVWFVWHRLRAARRA